MEAEGEEPEADAEGCGTAGRRGGLRNGGPGAGAAELHETRVPGRSEALEPGFHGVAGGAPEGALLGVLGGGFAVRGLLGGDAPGGVGGRGGGTFHGG